MNARNRRPSEDHDSSTAGVNAPIDLAEAQVRRVTKALAEAEGALAEAEAALAAADESDGKAFDRALAKRDAAKGRRDELKGRLAFAERALVVAREQAVQAERAEHRRRRAEVEDEIREFDEVIVREVLKFRVELADAIRDQRVRLGRALELDVRVGDQPNRNRSFWANVAAGEELRAAWLTPEAVKASQTAAAEARLAAAKGEREDLDEAE